MRFTTEYVFVSRTRNEKNNRLEDGTANETSDSLVLDVDGGSGCARARVPCGIWLCSSVPSGYVVVRHALR